MPAKILVVDDEPTLPLLIRKAFRKRIQRGDLSFTFATNGVEALEQVGQDPEIDIIVSDIKMPQMDGLTLLSHLRELNHPTLKTIIVSAYDDFRNIRTAMNRGAFDFLIKPIDLEDLTITIDRTLEQVNELKEAVRAKQQAQEARIALQRQEAQRASEQQLIQFLEAMPVGIFVVDAAGKPYYANRTTSEVLGQAIVSDLQPQQWLAQARVAGTEAMYPPERLPLVQALQGQTVYADDLELHQSGRSLILEVAATPIFNEADELVFAIATFQDITQRKQVERVLANYQRDLETQIEQQTRALRQSEATNQAILRAIPDLLVRMNREGQPVAAIAHSEAEPVQEVLQAVFPPDLAAQRLEYIQETLATGELHVYEYQVSASDTPRYEEARIVPIDANEVLLVVRDITNRKQAEVELAAARDAAELASQAKGAFLASVSHELRTPLNAILGFSQLMAAEPNLDPTHQEYLTLIEQSGTHLLALIDDVLTMSRLGSDRLEAEISSFDLHYLLDSLRVVLQPKAEGQQLQLFLERSPDLPQWIETDKSKLRRILLNLLNNALRYTTAGTVTLAATVSRLEDDRCRLYFEVRDTGPGIPEEELPDLFVPLVQGRAGRESGGGSGLGLALSRECARALGGDVTVETQVGRGSCFRVEIAAIAHQERVRDEAHCSSDPLPESAAILRAQDLQVMPATWRAELHQAAVIVDNHRLAQLIAAIPPSAAHLSTGLNELLDNFRLDTIALLSESVPAGD